MQTVEKNVARFFAGVLAMTIAGGAASQQSAPRAPVVRPMPALVQRSAQTQPAAPAPATTEAPQSTTATYEDWVVQCQIRSGPPVEKVCDMAQVTQVQGRNIPFSRVAIAHPVKGQPIKLVVQLPVNASFATNVRIQIGEADAGIAMPFARCLPNGCFADFELKDDLLKKFRTAATAGKLSFADAGGHDVAVPLSFKGFAQAYDALAKE